jgi:hypothetical protein
MQYRKKRLNDCGNCWKRYYVLRIDSGPFSRPKPKASLKRLGRNAGKQYGRPYHRPLPDAVDEAVEAPLPTSPRYGGGLEECETVSRFQTEIPEPRVERIEFRFLSGAAGVADDECRALGTTSSQLGALALAAQLNKV